MNYQKHNVDSKHLDFIECIYSWEGYASKSITIESPPSALTALVLNFGDDVHLTNPLYKRKKLPNKYISGQSTRSFRFHLEGEIKMLGIVFKATGLYNYFGLEMDNFLDKREAITSVFSEKGIEALNEKRDFSIDREVQVLRDFITNISTKSNHANPEVVKVSNQIFDDKGNTPIIELIEKTFMSRRTFERKFLKQVGLSPKYYAKLRRFGYTCAMMAGSQEIILTDVLYKAGYYDQSHFIKDFKYFTGKTPKLYNETNNELIHYVKDTFYKNLRD